MKHILCFIDCEEKEILRWAEDFQRASTHFRYEGKFYLGKNAKAAKRAIQRLGQSADRHSRFQSGGIFPFLEKHFPRHSPAVHLLQAEHDNILKNKKKLAASLQRFSKGSAGLAWQSTIYQRGIYLISLLRHHLGFEKKNIYRSIKKELHRKEYEEIKKKMNRWNQQHILRG